MNNIKFNEKYTINKGQEIITFSQGKGNNINVKPSPKTATFITTKFVTTYAQIKIHRDTDCSLIGSV